MYYFLVTLCAATLTLLIPLSHLHSSEASREKYTELVRQSPRLITPLGDASQGQIEIITDPQKMAEIEQKTGRDVGVIFKDFYWIWINDACLFPSGQEGVYSRILWNKEIEGPSGVAVMPILPDGRIVVNCNFRHATRAWEIELPRGTVRFGEDLETAARRETVEETGMVVESLTLLGGMPPDAGVIGTIVRVYVSKVASNQATKHDASEAIESILALSLDEIKRGFCEGELVCSIRGVQERVAFRDPFLAYAILLYELKGLN